MSGGKILKESIVGCIKIQRGSNVRGVNIRGINYHRDHCQRDELSRNRFNMLPAEIIKMYKRKYGHDFDHDSRLRNYFAMAGITNLLNLPNNQTDNLK